MSRTTQGLATVVTPLTEHARWSRVTVAKDEQGWWVGLESTQVLEYLPTLTQAIHLGRQLAHQHKPCVLTVHHADGELERYCFEPEEDAGLRVSL